MILREGSKLEEIGKECFWKCGIVEIAIPKTVKTIDITAFGNCDQLRTVYVEKDYKISLSHTVTTDSVTVLFSDLTHIWNTPLLELRRLKEITVPDGIEKIDNYLFWGSNVESVEISFSVKEIGTEAFCYCR